MPCFCRFLLLLVITSSAAGHYRFPKGQILPCENCPGSLDTSPEAPGRVVLAEKVLSGISGSCCTLLPGQVEETQKSTQESLLGHCGSIQHLETLRKIQRKYLHCSEFPVVTLKARCFQFLCFYICLALLEGTQLINLIQHICIYKCGFVTLARHAFATKPQVTNSFSSQNCGFWSPLTLRISICTLRKYIFFLSPSGCEAKFESMTCLHSRNIYTWSFLKLS